MNLQLVTTEQGRINRTLGIFRVMQIPNDSNPSWPARGLNLNSEYPKFNVCARDWTRIHMYEKEIRSSDEISNFVTARSKF